MNVSDTNKLYDVIGSFVGLAEEEDIYIRFREFNREDEGALAAVVDEFVLPDFGALGENERRESLEVLGRLASQSRDVQMDEWNSMLPPFPYPETVNLFQLIHERLRTIAV